VTRIPTGLRPQLKTGEVFTAPGNVRVVDGAVVVLPRDLPPGMYRVIRVDDEGFEVAPHRPRHLGSWKGWIKTGEGT
jgi:hypothetical protein